MRVVFRQSVFELRADERVGPATRQPPRREFAIEHSKARAKGAGLQAPGISAATSWNVCGGLHRIQHPAEFAEPWCDACTPCTLGICLEQGGGVTAAGLSKAQQNRTELIW